MGHPRYALAQFVEEWAKSRKAAGSILYGVIGVFHSLNSDGSNMALELTQLLMEMSNGGISCGIKAAGA